MERERILLPARVVGFTEWSKRLPPANFQHLHLSLCFSKFNLQISPNVHDAPNLDPTVERQTTAGVVPAGCAVEFRKPLYQPTAPVRYDVSSCNQ